MNIYIYIHFLKLAGDNILFLKLCGGSTQLPPHVVLLFVKLYICLNCIYVLYSFLHIFGVSL